MLKSEGCPELVPPFIGPGRAAPTPQGIAPALYWGTMVPPTPHDGCTPHLGSTLELTQLLGVQII